MVTTLYWCVMQSRAVSPCYSCKIYSAKLVRAVVFFKRFIRMISSCYTRGNQSTCVGICFLLPTHSTCGGGHGVNHRQVVTQFDRGSQRMVCQNTRWHCIAAVDVLDCCCRRNYEVENESRSIAEYVGLKNLGATCYVNSLLQQVCARVPSRDQACSSRVDHLIIGECSSSSAVVSDLCVGQMYFVRVFRETILSSVCSVDRTQQSSSMLHQLHRLLLFLTYSYVTRLDQA